MTNAQEILNELGYQLTPDGNGWRTTANFRNGTNSKSLKIFENGSFYDFGSDSYGSLKKLIGLALGIDSPKEIDTYVEQKKWDLPDADTIQIPVIKQAKIYPDNTLEYLVPKFDYAISRGISKETCELLKCGLVEKDCKMKNRFTFPIFNNKKQIIGFAGRAIYNSPMKWKFIGIKGFFNYPLFINIKEIQKKKEVVLVESIFDCLSLYEAGVKNSFVLFGLSLSSFQLTTLLKLGLNRVIISTNNDSEKNNAGNNAATKIKQQLLRYFDKKNIIIKLPKLNDWNEVLTTEGKDSIVTQICEN